MELLEYFSTIPTILCSAKLVPHTTPCYKRTGFDNRVHRGCAEPEVSLAELSIGTSIVVYVMQELLFIHFHLCCEIVFFNDIVVDNR